MCATETPTGLSPELAVLRNQHPILPIEISDPDVAGEISEAPRVYVPEHRFSRSRGVAGRGTVLRRLYSLFQRPNRPLAPKITPHGDG